MRRASERNRVRERDAYRAIWGTLNEKCAGYRGWVDEGERKEGRGGREEVRKKRSFLLIPSIIHFSPC